MHPCMFIIKYKIIWNHTTLRYVGAAVVEYFYYSTVLNTNHVLIHNHECGFHVKMFPPDHRSVDLN